MGMPITSHHVWGHVYGHDMTSFAKPFWMVHNLHLSNATSLFSIVIDVTLPLPTLITLEPSRPFHPSISLVLNPQTTTPFDATVYLFPSFMQPSLNGNIHVDSLATSSKNMVISSDLHDIESNLNLLPMHPPHKLKKSYDCTRKFQLEWVVKLLWAVGVLVIYGVLH